ncbi:NblA/ycf18 family protein [Egbenema bharatensis]|uniref:NblA/ycf18 family protein n=1 Tax=Egbenema bharatensis TaxID=3463334 RepID=UPI003A85B6CC
MESDRQLSLEQEFDLRLFSEQVKGMSLEQTQECLLKLHENMMLRENMYREILKDAWGIGKGPFAGSDPFYA